MTQNTQTPITTAVTQTKDKNLVYLNMVLNTMVAEDCFSDEVKQILIDKYKNGDLETKKVIFNDVVSQASKIITASKNMQTTYETFEDIIYENLMENYKDYLKDEFKDINPEDIDEEGNFIEPEMVEISSVRTSQPLELEQLLNQLPSSLQPARAKTTFEHSSANVRGQTNPPLNPNPNPRLPAQKNQAPTKAQFNSQFPQTQPIPRKLQPLPSNSRPHRPATGNKINTTGLVVPPTPLQNTPRSRPSSMPQNSYQNTRNKNIN
jgi:hypothetical protein